MFSTRFSHIWPKIRLPLYSIFGLLVACFFSLCNNNIILPQVQFRSFGSFPLLSNYSLSFLFLSFLAILIVLAHKIHLLLGSYILTMYTSYLEIYVGTLFLSTQTLTLNVTVIVHRLRGRCREILLCLLDRDLLVNYIQSLSSVCRGINKYINIFLYDRV